MAHTVLESPRVTTAFQGDRLSSIVGANHKLIRLSTGVFCMNGVFGLCDLGFVHQETRIPKKIYLVVCPISAALVLTVGLILMALLTHEQIDEITHCGTGPNVKSRSLHR